MLYANYVVDSTCVDYSAIRNGSNSYRYRRILKSKYDDQMGTKFG